MGWARVAFIHQNGGATRTQKGSLAMNNLARLVSQIFGVILTLVGLMGFIPALTPDGQLLGIFAVNPAHNLVHLLTGVLGLVAGFMMGGQYARLYTLIFGLVYTVVAIVGFVQGTTILGVLPTGLADNILHALLAISFLGAYFATPSESAASPRVA